jgi:hypothetical protein
MGSIVHLDVSAEKSVLSLNKEKPPSTPQRLGDWSGLWMYAIY